MQLSHLLNPALYWFLENTKYSLPQCHMNCCSCQLGCPSPEHSPNRFFSNYPGLSSTIPSCGNQHPKCPPTPQMILTSWYSHLCSSVLPPCTSIKLCDQQHRKWYHATSKAKKYIATLLCPLGSFVWGKSVNMSQEHSCAFMERSTGEGTEASCQQ